MTGDRGRTVSTCAIWAATACIFVFSGLYRITGDLSAVVVMIVCTGMVALSAFGGTAAVWSAGKRPAEKGPDDPASRDQASKAVFRPGP